jgi:hypothetical protein
MTHKIINKNIVNIKIGDKKKSKRRKRHGKTSHINAPYNPVASFTNRPQYLDTSTASNREKESIVNQAIMNVKRENEILAIKNVKRENEILAIKDKMPEASIVDIFEVSTPPPVLIPKSIKKITDFFSKSPSNNLYDVYPKEKEKETNFADRFEVIDEFTKARAGRPMKQKKDETGEQYIERMKKGKSATAFRENFKTPNKDDIPAATSHFDPIPPNTIIPLARSPNLLKKQETLFTRSPNLLKKQETLFKQYDKAMKSDDYMNKNSEKIMKGGIKDTAREERLRKRNERQNFL